MGSQSKLVRVRHCKWCERELRSTAVELRTHAVGCKEQKELDARLEAAGLLSPAPAIVVPKMNVEGAGAGTKVEA